MSRFAVMYFAANRVEVLKIAILRRVLYAEGPLQSPLLPCDLREFYPAFNSSKPGNRSEIPQTLPLTDSQLPRTLPFGLS